MLATVGVEMKMAQKYFAKKSAPWATKGILQVGSHLWRNKGVQAKIMPIEQVNEKSLPSLAKRKIRAASFWDILGLENHFCFDGGQPLVSTGLLK